MTGCIHITGDTDMGHGTGDGNDSRDSTCMEESHHSMIPQPIPTFSIILSKVNLFESLINTFSFENLQYWVKATSQKESNLSV